MISISEAQLAAWITALLWPFLRVLALLSALPVLGQRTGTERPPGDMFDRRTPVQGSADRGEAQGQATNVVPMPSMKRDGPTISGPSSRSSAARRSTYLVRVFESSVKTWEMFSH